MLIKGEPQGLETSWVTPIMSRRKEMMSDGRSERFEGGAGVRVFGT